VKLEGGRWNNRGVKTEEIKEEAGEKRRWKEEEQHVERQ
jgi:hypothetical protein